MVEVSKAMAFGKLEAERGWHCSCTCTHHLGFLLPMQELAPKDLDKELYGK